jgi:hypothetical protein
MRSGFAEDYDKQDASIDDSALPRKKLGWDTETAAALGWTFLYQSTVHKNCVNAEFPAVIISLQSLVRAATKVDEDHTRVCNPFLGNSQEYARYCS